MDSKPPNLLLLLTSLIHFWQCARGQSLYTIDTVGLTVQPSSTVESGTQVILRCEVSVSHDPFLHLTHSFQFLRYDVPVHSLTTSDTVVLYEINPARAADSGTYECQVTVEEKSKTSFIQKLTVEGLQAPIFHLSKTTLYESEELIATCSAPQEKGSLIFHFYQESRNAVPQKIKQVGPSGNASETRLVLRQAGDSYLYCDYEIPTLPEAGRSNISNKVQVIVRGLFISPVMNVMPSSNVYEGDIIEVVCRVVHPLRNIEVFLTKDRKVLKKASVSLNHRMTVQAGDSGELVCKAEWNEVQKETYLSITVKELFSVPQLIVEPIDIFEGKHFKLTCSVSIYSPERINNETMQFSIYKDHVQLTKTDTYIARAQPSQNGNYTCKAEAATLRNNFLVKESEAHVIKAKVPVSQPMLSVVGDRLILGKPFLLLCDSELGSVPITYTLYGPNRQPDVKVVSRPGDQAIFNISAIYKSSDVLKFLCHAKNNAFNPPMISSSQRLQRTTSIIEPVSEPALIIYPNMGDVSEGQDLTLDCTLKKGTPPINFTWYHAETEGALASQTSPGLKGSYRIKGVRAEHGGGYYCVSTNQANEIKRSYTVTVGVKLAGWKKGLIAVVCILLIAALVLVIAIKKGLLPFKRKGTGVLLSVKSASTKTERLSLTLAEVNEAANVTPGVMGKSVWSEHVSGSESDDQNSVTSPECPEPQYTEVQTKQADPCTVPVMKGTETVYSEVRNSKQGAPEEANGGSVEYVQMNHDTDCHGEQGNHGDHSEDDHLDDIDNIDDTNDTSNINPGDSGDPGEAMT
ncbi:hypothetical protein LDENG_00001590 [Lucifuga dentata]|nr:hypothetical protein LDENG_00001590 [Lucifuga dentata]